MLKKDPTQPNPTQPRRLPQPQPLCVSGENLEFEDPDAPIAGEACGPPDPDFTVADSSPLRAYTDEAPLMEVGRQKKALCCVL